MEEVEVRIHAFLISAQAGGQWLASPFSSFTGKDRALDGVIFFFNADT
jgi:hypothetical protein